MSAYVGCQSIRQLGRRIYPAKEDISNCVTSFLAKTSGVENGSDVGMIVPSDCIEWSTGAIDDDGVVANGSHRSHRLFSFETRSEVLSIIPLSTLSSKIDDTYTSPIACRRGIARLICVIEIVKISVDL